MSETTNQITPVSDASTLKRAISMSWFASKKAKQRIISTGMLDDADPAKVKLVTLGQLLGAIYSVTERVSTRYLNADGTPKTDLLAVGDFEGVNYETGENITAHACYLPRYYLETLAEILKKNQARVVTFSVEVCLEATGKDMIPVAYTIRNLVSRRADNPIEVMKRELAKKGQLRLKAPPVEHDPYIEALPDEPAPAITNEAAPAEAAKPAEEAATSPADFAEPEPDEADGATLDTAAPRAKGGRHKAA